MLVGDFKCILDSSERVGYSLSVHRGCNLLQGFMFNLSLKDLGCVGSRFT